MHTNVEYWLWFTLAFGPANSDKWNVYTYYDRSIETCFDRLTSGDLSRVLPGDVSKVKSATLEHVHKIIDLCESNGISICTYDSELYPQRLRDIFNPPSVLFYTGDISGIDDNIVVAAVGTRKPTEYSVSMSKRLCTELVSRGARIASGFQIGLDSLAHICAIAAGGITYAVLPCGHLYDYPPENAKAKETVSKHGAVISEFFPNDKPTRHTFRARNRILAGISIASLVLQAGAGSGAMSTAYITVDQGKEIYCIPPHNLYDPEYYGATELIRQGAHCIFDSSDIINTYAKNYPHIIPVNRELIKPIENVDDADEKPAPKRKPSSKKKSDTVHVNHAPKHLVKTPIVPNEELSGIKKQIVDYLKEHGETHLDELAVGIGDVFELEVYLTELELDGLISSLPGNRFTI